MDEQYNQIHEQVRRGYSRIAEEKGEACCGPSSCCGGDSGAAAESLAESVGYNPEDLKELPQGANMGLSCGNPVALASLKEGDVVLDLGSGGGFDVFIAGKKVGADGRVIGIDMTPEMITKARRNLFQYRKQTGLDNVEFRLGEIEHLPVPDECVDVVISNCVINLSPDKQQVWREIARTLKPGGRVSASDIALLKPLPESVRQSVEALVGCVAGAVLVEETREMARSAGLINVKFDSKPGYIENMIDCSDPVFRELSNHLPPGAALSDFVTSVCISASKPEKQGSQRD